ncbi:MAG TPA: hypothetical protein VJV79_06155 [Polyangiaceae bacterium]|nr:hypothetical protein [Polyangiaceae bacterium]
MSLLHAGEMPSYWRMAQLVGLSTVMACGAADGTPLIDGQQPADETALAIPAIEGDVATSANVAPTLVDPDGQPLPAASENAGLDEKIFTAINPAGSRSRQRGAIYIRFINGGTCSGSIVNNGVIITAAHCLPVPNRNRFEDVEIFYQYPADPNQPFCPDCGPPERTWTARMFFYPHPSQTKTSGIDRRWDFAVGAICSPGSACDSPGTVTQSLGLASSHFVTLSTHVLVDNNGLTVHGYGAPESRVQHQMSIRVDDAEPDRISWEYVNPAEWWCDGDSGGPAFRNAGYTDTMGRYWQAQAAVMTSMNTNATFGSQECGDTGRASNVRKKTAWIASIVDFWTSRKCQQFTNPAGETALWCWAT